MDSKLDELWSSIVSYATTAGVRLVGTILVVIVGFALIGKLSRLLKKSKGFGKIDETARNFLIGFISVSLKVVLLLVAADTLGVPMTNIVAILGSCGLAIGLALQGSLTNLAGGLMLIIFHPFKDGDYIESGSAAGTVKDISILYTYLVTPDNKEIVVPNGALSNAVVVNYSAEENRRMDVEIGVAYDSDLNVVKNTLLRIAAENPMVLQSPAPEANVTDFKDSSITVGLRVWMKNADYWAVYYALRNALKEKFDENAISIPYPQLDVHMK